jgi:2-amino-4-hydroxy-6-hydroxymethyldihydropteridine diphosphokinase
LDIDLIAVGDSVSPDIDGYLAWQRIGLKDQAKSAPLGLILPHPRLQDRAFVLVPLADVAPDWCHPVLGQTVDQMLAALPKPDRNAVVAVNGSNFSGLALVNRGERP